MRGSNTANNAAAHPLAGGSGGQLAAGHEQWQGARRRVRQPDRPIVPVQADLAACITIIRAHICATRHFRILWITCRWLNSPLLDSASAQTYQSPCTSPGGESRLLARPRALQMLAAASSIQPATLVLLREATRACVYPRTSRWMI